MSKHTPRVFSEFEALRRTAPATYYDLTTQRRMYNSHRRLGSAAFFDQAHKQ